MSQSFPTPSWIFQWNIFHNMFTIVAIVFIFYPGYFKGISFILMNFKMCSKSWNIVGNISPFCPENLTEIPFLMIWTLKINLSMLTPEMQKVIGTAYEINLTPKSSTNFAGFKQEWACFVWTKLIMLSDSYELMYSLSTFTTGRGISAHTH